MTIANRAKQFYSDHPAGTVITVSAIGLCVGWKLNNRSIAKAARKAAEQVIEIEASRALFDKLLVEGRPLVFNLPKPQKATQVVLYLTQAVTETTA